MNSYKVTLSKAAKNNLKKIPTHIVIKLYEWIEAVSHDGLLEVRKIPGYHDEPLKGSRKGQRSIRLSLSYRAIYRLGKDGQMDVVDILEVNNHDY